MLVVAEHANGYHHIAMHVTYTEQRLLSCQAYAILGGAEDVLHTAYNKLQVEPAWGSTESTSRTHKST
eukprot:6210168-Pleurochrysis_carterae.AAC.5